MRFRLSLVDMLLQELYHRLHHEPGPRLLIDGCWLSRPHGGISRVWQQILSTWQLPGLINSEAPVALIDRNSQYSFTSSLSIFEREKVDPLDPLVLAGCPPRMVVWLRSGMPMCSVLVGLATLALIFRLVLNSLWSMIVCLNAFGPINQN